MHTHLFRNHTAMSTAVFLAPRQKVSASMWLLFSFRIQACLHPSRGTWPVPSRFSSSHPQLQTQKGGLLPEESPWAPWWAQSASQTTRLWTGQGFSCDPFLANCGVGWNLEVLQAPRPRLRGSCPFPSCLSFKVLSPWTFYTCILVSECIYQCSQPWFELAVLPLSSSKTLGN